MPADTLSREEIERWLADLDSHGADLFSPMPLEDLAGARAGMTERLWKIAPAALRATLSEPARLASAHARGVREGIEHARRIAEEWLCQNCGSWFHPQDAEPCCARPNWEREHKAGELVELLAALSPPPAEPPGMTAEPDICRSCDGSGEGVADTTCNRCDGSGSEPSAPVAAGSPGTAVEGAAAKTAALTITALWLRALAADLEGTDAP